MKNFHIRVEEWRINFIIHNDRNLRPFSSQSKEEKNQKQNKTKHLIWVFIQNYLYYLLLFDRKVKNVGNVCLKKKRTNLLKWWWWWRMRKGSWHKYAFAQNIDRNGENGVTQSESDFFFLFFTPKELIRFITTSLLYRVSRHPCLKSKIFDDHWGIHFHTHMEGPKPFIGQLPSENLTLVPVRHEWNYHRDIISITSVCDLSVLWSDFWIYELAQNKQKIEKKEFHLAESFQTREIAHNSTNETA